MALAGGRVKALGIAGMAGVAWYAAVLAFLQLAAPASPDWTRHLVSQFANGPNGWLLSAGTLGHAAGNAALALGLRRAMEANALRDQGTGLLLAAAFAIALAGAASVEPPEEPAALAGAVHRAAASAAFGLELLALALLTLAFRRDARWRAAARASAGLALLAVASSAVLAGSLFAGWRPGLSERAALVAFMAWEWWAGFRIAFRTKEMPWACESR